MRQSSVYQRAGQRLAYLINTGQQRILKGGKIGLEKESLRLGSDGSIAQTPHPAALGSALTHPYITTDYSEALLELITPAYTDSHHALQFLECLHRFMYSQLDNELLWAASMPCVVNGEQGVPIAWYGKSNVGMMKHVYRRGLGYRYGKVMQVIAGIHFNYSLPDAVWPVLQQHEQNTRPLQDFISEQYFAMIRNVQRYGWLVLYLFGASPAICKSFMAGKQPQRLQEYNNNSYYEPYATSLRMSDIGYSNKARENLTISYNHLTTYSDDLERALATPYPPYEAIGVVVDGYYRQLNSNMLQIANEYYSIIRPKQPLQGNEKPTTALRERGVQYVELRALDLNPYQPLGIGEQQSRFLEAFLIFCLLCDSPNIDADEQRKIDDNQLAVACFGRDPELRLNTQNQAVLLKDWAHEFCQAMTGVCELLDQGEAEQPYMTALNAQLEAVQNPELTPSARVLADMQQQRQGFFHFSQQLSEQHRDDFKNSGLTAEQIKQFHIDVELSHQQQRDIEAADRLSFADYLARYFQPA